MRFVLAILIVAVAAMAVPGASASVSGLPAQHPPCLATITSSFRLDRDVTGCATNGWTITKDNVTIDLGGHRLSGDGSDTDASGNSETGIGVLFHRHVTIRNGVIDGFEFGIQAVDSPAIVVDSIEGVNNSSSGFVIGSTDGIVRRSTASGGGDGFDLYAARIVGNVATRNLRFGFLVSDSLVHNPRNDPLVARNVAAGNRDDGFRIDLDRATVLRNKAVGNGADGIAIDADSSRAVVRRNLASGNRGNGISAAKSADGVRAPVISRNVANGNGFPKGAFALGIAAPDASGGGNHALGNETAPNCLPTTLCAPVRGNRHLRPMHPACGTTITTSFRLDADVGPCDHDGWNVIEPNVTIDLAGHTLYANTTTQVADDVGISAAVGGVVIRNGVVRGFDTGINVSSLPRNDVVKGVVVVGSAHDGLLLSGIGLVARDITSAANGRDGMNVTAKVIARNVSIRNSRDGAFVGATSIDKTVAAGNVIAANGAEGFALGNADGVLIGNTSVGNVSSGLIVRGLRNVVARNLASGNGLHGIVIESVADDARVVANVARGNGFGSADGNGLGVVAEDPADVTGNGNSAKGSDDPDDCFPSTLCVP